jgi:hypothetical protein
MAKKAATTTPRVVKKSMEPAVKEAATRKRAARRKPLTNGSPAYDDVARLAYELWERRGRPDGSAQEDWFRAEVQLSS